METRPADPAPLVMRPGVQVGRFRLSYLLGMGGMGSVWAATDPELGREVAIKVLRIGVGSDGDQAASRTRLRREAKAMARLSHPNVVPVFEIGEVQGRLFLVMELVEGETLAKWLETKRTLPKLLDIFTGAGQGLAAAHAAGVVHRDFKPQNVLVGKDGRARVLDFGLARGFTSGEADSLPPGADVSLSDLAALPAGANALTPNGALLGTPAYMSPEQMRGQKADGRSDLFAYCTVFFEAIFGMLPYQSKTFLERRARVEAGQTEWPKKPRVPRWLRRELRRGLRPGPAQRQASMDELLAAIQRGRARDSRWVWLAAAVLVAALGVVALRRPLPPRGPRTVAVLSPHNASAHADAGWISPVFAELVANDLAGDPTVRVVPEAEVAAAMRDLGLRGEVPQPSEVFRLKKRLGADVLLGGIYSLSEVGTLRAELVLWAPDGKTTFVSQQGDQAHLTELATRVCAGVRSGLGLAEHPANAAIAFPANLETARLYAEGLRLLHDYEAARASEALAKAAALSPDSARIQLALAEALLFLREETQAREAARRAFELGDSLSLDDRVRAEIFYRRTLGDHDRAVALAHARYAAAPADLSRGLDVAEELISARRWPEIAALTAGLRQLPPPAGNDARIDLAESLGCLRSADLKCALASSQRAYATALERGARWQMASARYHEGEAIRRQGDAVQALPKLAEADRLYTGSGDRGSAASVRLMSATIYADQGDLPGARREFETALKTFGELGDRAGEGATLHDLAILLRRARELPAALAYASRATTNFLEQGALRQGSNAMTTLGNLRLDLGDLSGALTVLSQAADMRRKEKDPLVVSTLTALAAVRLLQGDFAAMKKLLDEARENDKGQEPTITGRIRFGAATLALAKGRLDEAAAEATKAAKLFKDGQRLDEQALSEAAVAESLLRAGHLDTARLAVNRAKEVVAKSSSRLARPQVAVMDAKVFAAEQPAHLDEPLRLLKEVASEAEKTGVSADQWEARLAAAQLEHQADNLAALARDARAQGLILYALQAEAAKR
jgi:predicted Ser/Thr protein kinase